MSNSAEQRATPTDIGPAVPLRAAPAPDPDADPVPEVVLVTPAMAQEWLGTNTRNRALKRAKIEEYARDMAAGRWRVTGEAIKFGQTGRLLDGQNRLHAVIRCGRPVRTLVVRGIPDDAQDVMDSGAARTAADGLSLAGVRNAAKVAGAARIAMAVEIDGRVGHRKFSNSEVQAWVLDHLEITDAPDLIGADARMIPVAPSVRVYAAYRFALVDTAAAEQFLSQLATGIGIDSATSPVVALRRRLSGVYGTERRMTADQQLTAMFRAWNAWRQGRPMSRIMGDDRFGHGLPDLV